MRVRIGMRWWLTAVFALIAAVTAIVAGQLVAQSSEREFRHRAEQLAAGNAFEAAIAVRRAPTSSSPRKDGDAARFSHAVETIATKREIALFVFNRQASWSHRRALTAFTSTRSSRGTRPCGARWPGDVS